MALFSFTNLTLMVTSNWCILLGPDSAALQCFLMIFVPSLYSHNQKGSKKLQEKAVFDIQKLANTCMHRQQGAATIAASFVVFFNSSIIMGKLVQTSTISEYNLGGEGDLFKAPEPITTIIEEPILDLYLATISIISGGEDGICSQAVKLTDILTMQTGPLLDDVFYEWNDLLEKPVMHESSPEIPDVKVPVKMTGEGLASDHGSDGTIQKSTSSGCLTSTGKNSGLPTKSNFLNFQGLDIDTSGMRRAFSEGDMQTLISMGTVVVQSPRLLPVGCYTREEREERLLRYRKKKNRRNFGRKIKYAFRKALADSQPRVRGRFARIEETAIHLQPKTRLTQKPGRYPCPQNEEIL